MGMQIMKRISIYAAVLILMAISLTSCEVEKCQECELVTRGSSGNFIRSTDKATYCDAELTTFKLANPAFTNPLNGEVTKVECK